VYILLDSLTSCYLLSFTYIYVYIYLTGLGIIAKVFTGRTVCTREDTLIKPSNYPDADSVFCLLSDAIDSDESSTLNGIVTARLF
jgi:hypothetical protein